MDFPHHLPQAAIPLGPQLGKTSDHSLVNWGLSSHLAVHSRPQVPARHETRAALKTSKRFAVIADDITSAAINKPEAFYPSSDIRHTKSRVCRQEKKALFSQGRDPSLAMSIWNSPWERMLVELEGSNTRCSHSVGDNRFMR